MSPLQNVENYNTHASTWHSQSNSRTRNHGNRPQLTVRNSLLNKNVWQQNYSSMPYATRSNWEKSTRLNLNRNIFQLMNFHFFIDLPCPYTSVLRSQMLSIRATVFMKRIKVYRTQSILCGFSCDFVQFSYMYIHLQFSPEILHWTDIVTKFHVY